MRTVIKLSRKRAFQLAWAIFWMATGTSRVGIVVTNNDITIMGDEMLREEEL